MAILYSNSVWEGLSSEMDGMDGIAGIDGHFYKQLDTGAVYQRVAGEWVFLDAGFSFVKATKSGIVTTDSEGSALVIFNTPFIDAEYTVALTLDYPGDKTARLPYVVNKTASGFMVTVTDGKGHTITEEVTLSWLATRDYNP